MENQITAVEWLEQRLFDKLGMFTKGDIDQAKKMEKEQITSAWEDGKDSFSTRNSEKYYNETFKNN
jgi:hypothetical protein